MPAPPRAAPALAGGVSSPDDRAIDNESGDWIRALTDETTRVGAISLLRAVLLRASRFEVERRRGGLPHRDPDLDEVARAAAADALTQVLARLDEYRGASRFTTWASKFALREAAVRLRKIGWHEHEAPAADLSGADLDPLLPRELRSTFAKAIADALTPHQRDVFGTLAFTGMPIDVLADRLGTTRADVYETLRDARRLLRERLAERP
jgi:RNA polymerase sigma-70 factor (ECF subfamily)